MIHPTAYIHPTAILDPGASVQSGAKIWHFCHLREGSQIGELVSLGRDVHVDKGVSIGRGSRVQNGVSIYAGVEIATWCFVGPHVIFTNDLYPRVGRKSWKMEKTILNHGTSLGAGAVIVCGIEIGAFAIVGAGAVVTKNVPPFTLYYGFPAKSESRICACGDTHLPLTTIGSDLIQSCCRKNLEAEVLKIAEESALSVTAPAIFESSV